MITISTRIDENIVKEIEKIAQEMNIDKSVLIRKYILDGYQRNIMQKNINLVHQGELTIGQAAQNSNTSIYRILELARELEIPIGGDNSTLSYEMDVIKKHINIK